MSVQQSLTGDSVDEEEIELPDTWVECPECGEIMLRSWRFDHEHEVIPPKDLGRPESEQEDDDEDDEPEELGSVYRVELSYSVTYTFEVPAFSESQAVDIAKQKKFDARPQDGHHTHTRKRERGTVTTEDVPDDFDPYGSEPLHEAVERYSDNGEGPDRNVGESDE
jgi:hypothetical protein